MTEPEREELLAELAAWEPDQEYLAEMHEWDRADTDTAAHVAGCDDGCTGTQIDRMFNETHPCPCSCHNRTGRERGLS